jgi:hypothetical protein
MAKRRFRPEDAYRLRTTGEPDLSPDGRRIAFAVAEADEEKDRLRSSIWVASADGSSAPRRFTEGPADKSPAWSPDGRWLGYISVPDGKAERAHVRLAPLDGGVPTRVGDLPGPVSQFAWSPDSTRLVVVCRVGVPDRAKASAAHRNAPRVVRGLAARLDGVGWQDGRRHLFVLEVEDGSARQLTRGEYDHADPSFSPDGDAIAFASDRHPRRDDRQFRGDAWVVPANGGRPRRLTNGKGRVAFPVFSPDGATIAFAGQETDEWNEDTHIIRRARRRKRGPRARRARARSAHRALARTPRPVSLDRRPRARGGRGRPRFGHLAPGASRRLAEPRTGRRRHHHRRRGCPARPAGGGVHGLLARPAERGVRDYHRRRRACPGDAAERRSRGRGRVRAGRPDDNRSPRRHGGRVLHAACTRSPRGRPAAGSLCTRRSRPRATP